MRNQYWIKAGVLLLFGLLSVLLLRPTETKAGIFDAADEVTYKEYWVSHTQFTGGCNESEQPFGSFYIEPWGCVKSLEFQIPDDFSQALKAEIYLDLWRNHDERKARFSINDVAVHLPEVGSDWSRTPYIGDINLEELRKGTNTIRFWGGGYHVHDIAIRIYHDETHPLVAGAGSDVTPPDGALLTIQGDGAALAAGAGGKLQVDDNQLTLTANVSNGAKYVEFHSYYFGFDEDNDGQFRDWHNRGRNNWYPGGIYEMENGGTIDHAGTKATPTNGEYSVNWDISHIPDQDGVKFKIRVVDAAGNVREAAGGVSNEFELSRIKSLMALYATGFVDYGLYMEGTTPLTVDRNVDLPDDFVDAEYETAKILHSYWHTVIVNLNFQEQKVWPNFTNGDHWQLANNYFNPNMLRNGSNHIKYSFPDVAGGFGAFVEEPGPMFILQREAWAVDSSAPSTFGQVPAANETGVAAVTGIQVHLFDDQSGIDYSTIQMKVQGKVVTPTVSGAKHTASLKYQPPVGFEPDEVVEVYVEGCDLAGNCFDETYSFKVKGEDLPAGIVSDDFNSCTLNGSVWDFRDPVGDAGYFANGAALEITVPAGSNHDLWQAENDAPRMMQAVNNADFRISARFNSAVEENSQMQGFIVAEDEQNFLRFSMRHDGSNAYLEFYIFEDGMPIMILNLPLDEASPNVVPTDLAVERSGDTWKYLYLDENEEWVEARRVDNYAMTVKEVGLFAGNRGNPASTAPAFTSSIDFFFDDNDPIDPQDPNPLYLPVEIVGEGTVQKMPLCGNPVTLLAVPADDHFFQGWSSSSGAISGLTNPLNTSFTVGETVTATFHINELALNIEIVNLGPGEGGSVAVSPDKEVYEFGDQVVLTPNVPTGWEFMGWSGDIEPGDEGKNPLIITMDDDVDVTATFAFKGQYVFLPVVIK